MLDIRFHKSVKSNYEISAPLVQQDENKKICLVILIPPPPSMRERVKFGVSGGRGIVGEGSQFLSLRNQTCAYYYVQSPFKSLM